MIEEISNLDISGCNLSRLFHHKGLVENILTNHTISKLSSSWKTMQDDILDNPFITIQYRRLVRTMPVTRPGASQLLGRACVWQGTFKKHPLHFLTCCCRTLDCVSLSFCNLYEQLYKWNAFPFCHTPQQQSPPRIMKSPRVHLQASNWLPVNSSCFY